MNPSLKIAVICGVALLFCSVFLIFYQGNDKPEILRFIRKLTVYCIPITLFVSLSAIGVKIMSKKLNGIPMREQLLTSFDNVLSTPYQTVIFGNSRTYRGINPDMIDSLTYNFSFDNETFLEQYYKLQYLIEHNHTPKTIILGVDYFEFSFVSAAMSATYKDYFGSQYDRLLDSIQKSGVKMEFVQNKKPDSVVNTSMSGLFNRGMSQLISYLIRTIAGEPFQAPFLKPNGQYIIAPVPKANSGDFLKRDSTILNSQREKFEQIMHLTAANKIKVILLMPPCREIELNSYSKALKTNLNDYFFKFTQPDSVWYINMSESPDYIITDFMDDTHLTPLAADKFSKQLKDTLVRLQVL